MAEGKTGAGARVGAGRRIAAHVPTPHTTRTTCPPSRLTPRPASLPCAVSHAPFVSATLGLWLSFCPPLLLPWDRPDGWNLPLSQIQKGSLALYIPEEPSPFPSRSLLLPHPKTTPLLLGGLESIIITLKTPHFTGERAVVCLDYLCEVGGAELNDPHCSDEETEAGEAL